MNHLAHALLADPQPPQRLGNLFGDAVRGPLSRVDLPAGVLEGVRRHRQIDAMTDRHPASIRLRERFPRALRRYAGIVLDVAFDHYLIRRWPLFCDVDRESFTLEVYDVMHQNPALLPEPVRLAAPRMIARDFLNRCETMDGVMSVLASIDARLSQGFDVAAAGRTLEVHDGALEYGFTEVFSDLQRP
ncbi:ACP phosphodiesterase [Chromatocurvus halotolerans]|uniref:acyl carrier protein phosphodiesterase n=1 Tax=Chromatocurvus halotolerans TaxID=1132028 RepID=UPI0013C31569|nr:ACP phosphodiesterase [Chromatocurvus halotolerans]